MAIANQQQHSSKTQRLERTTLVIQLLLFTIGACVFAISLEVRPILRITKSTYQQEVSFFLELMLISGVAQMLATVFSCVAAFCRYAWAKYMAVGVSAFVMCLQVGGILSVFYLMARGNEMVSEHVFKLSFESWECKQLGSCENEFVNYIYFYMLPQVLMSSVAIILQILGNLHLWKLSANSQNKRKCATDSYLNNPNFVLVVT